MTAYYNEIEPYAARWLRNLIAAGHIAPGDVDERSIEDVTPTDLAGYTQCHFFAGIGVWSYALRMAGWPDDRRVWTGSCPCQPFSQAGKGGGVADERHLWPAWYHLIDLCRPPDIFGEQVASPAGLGWFDLVQADLERSGYAVGAADLCAASVGAPHIRQRLYFVADNNSERQPQRAERHGESDESEQPTPRRNDAGRCGGMGDDDDEGLEGRSLPAGGCTDQRTAWTPSDFVWCRDGKWRPVSASYVEVADGSPAGVGLVCASDEETETEVDEAMRSLRGRALSEASLRPVGGPHGVQPSAVLQSKLHGGGDAEREMQQPEPQQDESASSPENALRIVRAVAPESARASQGRGFAEQRAGKFDDLVPILPRSYTLAELRSDNRTAEALRILLRACEAEGMVFYAPHEVQAFWASASQKTKDRIRVAFDAAAWRLVVPFPLTRNARSRVGRLRAYGNAIVPQVAAEFIRSYLECRP